MSDKKRWYWVSIAGIVMICLLILLVFIPEQALPYEDAAILFRYAQNFGDGYGFMWNPGEEPVDGATDFLFTACLGVIYGFFRMPIEWLARDINFIAVVGIAWMGFRFIRKRINLQWGLLAALLLIASPLWLYLTTGFGVPFAAFWLLAFWLKWESMGSPGDHLEKVGPWVGHGLLGILAGLARPEFAILTGLLICVRVAQRPKWNRFIPFISSLGTFLLLGGMYLAFRITYFGSLLPAPFYRKVGIQTDIWANITQNIQFILEFGIFPVAILLTGLLFSSTRKFALRTMLISIVFGLFWLFINGETNFFFRYQYPIIPVLSVAAIAIMAKISIGQTSLKKVFWGLIILFSVFQFTDVYVVIPQQARLQDGRNAVGEILAQHEYDDYTLFTTEAGLLPFRSNWRTIDGLGLNNYSIAKNGLSEAVLKRHKPEIIMYHWHDFSGENVPKAYMDAEIRNWKIVEDYVQEQAYIRAGCFCPLPDDCHYYFVKPGFEHSEKLAKAISEVPYYRNWYQRFVKNDCPIE